MLGKCPFSPSEPAQRQEGAIARSKLVQVGPRMLSSRELAGPPGLSPSPTPTRRGPAPLSPLHLLLQGRFLQDALQPLLVAARGGQLRPFLPSTCLGSSLCLQKRVVKAD